MDEIKLFGEMLHSTEKLLEGGKKNLIFKTSYSSCYLEVFTIGTNLPYDMKQSCSVQLVCLKEDGRKS